MSAATVSADVAAVLACCASSDAINVVWSEWVASWTEASVGAGATGFFAPELRRRIATRAMIGIPMTMATMTKAISDEFMKGV